MDTIQKVKVRNMNSNRFPQGRAIPNQFLIWTENGVYFQSYESVIAFKPVYKGNEIEQPEVILDTKYWDYSTTTGKYRNMFLKETKNETEKKIADGTYKLADLNG